MKKAGQPNNGRKSNQAKPSPIDELIQRVKKLEELTNTCITREEIEAIKNTLDQMRDEGYTHCTQIEQIVERIEALETTTPAEEILRKLDNVQGIVDLIIKHREIVRRLVEASDRLDLRHYHVLFHNSMKSFADSLRSPAPASQSIRLTFPENNIKWDQFDDGTDKITIPELKTGSLADKDILFVANFEDDASTMAQLHVLTYLCELRIKSLTLLLPFFPVGTTERVAVGEEDLVPTANPLARTLSNLPRFGPPVRVMTYDIHALQEQFYFSNNAVADLRSAIPLLIHTIRLSNINCIAFPDDGAKKRFAGMFKDRGFEIVTCGKDKSSGSTKVTIQEGCALGKNVLIVDDQTKSGGTIFDCMKALKEQRATSVSAFVTHAVFSDSANPKHKVVNDAKDFWKQLDTFLENNARWFKKFYITDSIPGSIARINLLNNSSLFQCIQLAPQVLKDL